MFSFAWVLGTWTLVWQLLFLLCHLPNWLWLLLILALGVKNRSYSKWIPNLRPAYLRSSRPTSATKWDPIAKQNQPLLSSSSLPNSQHTLTLSIKTTSGLLVLLYHESINFYCFFFALFVNQQMFWQCEKKMFLCSWMFSETSEMKTKRKNIKLASFIKHCQEQMRPDPFSKRVT